MRIEAVKSLKKFVSLLSTEKILGILAYLQTLYKDTVALVRVAVCEVLFEIFKVCENVPPDSIKQRI